MNDRQRNTSRTASDNKPTLKKKWLALTAVGIALLLIPRRSSRQDSPLGTANSVNDNTAKSTGNKSNNHEVHNENATDSIG